MKEKETGCSLIEKERYRQINELGYDVKNDSLYENQQLSSAAAIYALSDPDIEWLNQEVGTDVVEVLWPWDKKYYKPTPQNRILELTKAGALIAAAIDRLLHQNEQLKK